MSQFSFRLNPNSFDSTTDWKYEYIISEPKIQQHLKAKCFIFGRPPTLNGRRTSNQSLAYRSKWNVYNLRKFCCDLHVNWNGGARIWYSEIGDRIIEVRKVRWRLMCVCFGWDARRPQDVPVWPLLMMAQAAREVVLSLRVRCMCKCRW